MGSDDPVVREDPLLRYLHPLMRWQWLEDVDATVSADPSPAGRAAYEEFHRKGLELTGLAHRLGVETSWKSSADLGELEPDDAAVGAHQKAGV